jgi:hypothetical protein
LGLISNETTEMSKVVVAGAVGLTGLYFLGLDNPPNSEEEVFDTSDPQLNMLLEMLKSLGIGLGTDLAVRAAWRGGKVAAKAVGKVATKATGKVAGKAASKAATTIAAKAATEAATNIAVKTATEAATTVGTKVATKAATEAATTVATKAATEAATTVATKAATEAATTVATKAATEAAATTTSTVVKAADATADAAKATKASVGAAKASKGTAMIAKLKGTPADLIMMILSQILIATLDLDPENFVNCETGEFDFNSWPDWAKTMISSIPFLGDVFDLIGNKLCFRAGCGKDQEDFNGLCYPPCRAGYKSDAGAPYNCYKQYPEWENNGMAHTFLNITKKMDTVVGSPLSECPAGMERHGALCYPTCKAGYDGVLDRCWASIQKVNIAGRIPDKRPCAAGEHDDGTSCHRVSGQVCGDDCSKGWDNCRRRGLLGECYGGCRESCSPVLAGIVATLFDRQVCGADEDKIDGLCYRRCGAGMEHVPGAPYDCRTKGDISYYRGAGESMRCPAGKVQDGALCYEPKMGWTLLAGTYSQDCPAGSTNIGVACQRDLYSRGAGNIPLSIRMKSRRS